MNIKMVLRDLNNAAVVAFMVFSTAFMIARGIESPWRYVVAAVFVIMFGLLMIDGRE